MAKTDWMGSMTEEIELYYTCLTAVEREFLDSFGGHSPRTVPPLVMPPFVEDEVPF